MVEFAISDTWTGTLANGSLDGAFSGTDNSTGWTTNYTGSFQTTRGGGP